MSSHTSLSDHCNSIPISRSVIHSEPLLNVLASKFSDVLSLSPVFCYRAGSGYPFHGYPVLGNSRGGFPLPSSLFVIRVPSPRWICLKRLSGLHLPRFGIGVFLLLGTVCPQHLLYPVLPLCPFSRAFPIRNLGRGWSP